MANKATMKDVAREAGVSIATVSFVLNESSGHPISEETRQAVLAAVKKLNYVRNNVAKGLRESRTMCIGVVTTMWHIRNSHVVRGILKELNKYGYSVILCQRGEDRADNSFLKYYFENKVDGFLYIGTNIDEISNDQKRALVLHEIPVVTLDCAIDRMIPSVDIDYFMGAYNAVKFMSERYNTKKIVAIEIEREMRQEQEREQGIAKAAYEHGIEIEIKKDTMYIGPVNDDQYYGTSMHCSEKIISAVDNMSEGDVLVLFWSGMEQWALKRMWQRGQVFPTIVLAQGFVAQELYDWLHYSYLPNNEIGKIMAEMIIARLKGENNIEHKLLIPEII